MTIDKGTGFVVPVAKIGDFNKRLPPENVLYCKRGDGMEIRSHTEMTKRLMADALKRLMAQKPLNKITIRQITEDCGVNRQTFYYHFEDIYDLMRWMFRQEALALLDQREGVVIWQDGLLQLLRYLEENREVCLCALHSVGHEQLRRFFRSEIYDIIYRTVDLVAADDDPEDYKAVLTNFYVSALTVMMESWLLGELSSGPEDLVAAAEQIIEDHYAGACLRRERTAENKTEMPSS